MTTDKARKRATRERMAKTGERYAAARRHTATKLPPRVEDPGMTDDAIRKGQRQDLGRVFRILDDWGGTERSTRHRTLAARRAGRARMVVADGDGRLRAGPRQCGRATRRPAQVSVQQTSPRRPTGSSRRSHRPRQRNRLDVDTHREEDRAGPGRRGLRRRGRIACAIYLVPKRKESTAVQVVQTKMTSASTVATQRAFWASAPAGPAEVLG